MAVVQRRQPPGKNYPPLLLAALMMLGLLAVLPSALNLPQTNPAETLEYAPVPPEDQDTPPPAAGNFSSLGLGSSSGIAASASPEAELPGGGEVAGRAVKKPSTKRCVGTPPRQTEDPLAPPCVGFFEGDNGGATYQGVTRDEVRIIIMVTGFSSTGNWKGNDTSTPVRKYYDLAEPPKDDDHSVTRFLRAWQQYFNERYQTYGRFVHFWAYYPGPSRVEDRKADAVDNYNKIKPFAVIWPIGVANIPAYTDVMASKGVLSFTGLFGLRSATFAKYPKMNWGFLPSLEEHSKSFSAYICEKVAGKPVEFSGNIGENGQPRKYGLIYSAAAITPYTKDFVGLVEPQLKKCGVEFAIRRTHPEHGVAYDASAAADDYAPEAMAAFQQEGVTTILWLFGFETNFSKSAAAISYRPEWILAGDGLSEGNWNAQDQEQSVWDHAVTFTLMTKTGPMGISTPCKDAYITVDPEIPRGTLDLTQACFFYNGLRQLFTGIQVSGSRLNPATMDKGFHAIPAIRSSDPSVPACYYAPGDYTCVKDGTILWYDSQFQDENSVNTPGCWRLTDGGQRYTPGQWPGGNAMAQRKDSDPCNGNLGGRNVDD
ncbi:MAG TPA: hypothetical protein VMY88_08500 [Acidimicrobiales bacterium]|nr:hypothetical protein [Acidimicrobiales bacterium]